MTYINPLITSGLYQHLDRYDKQSCVPQFNLLCLLSCAGGRANQSRGPGPIH